MLGPGLPRDEKAGLLIGPLVLGQVGAVSGSILARGRRCVLFIVIFVPWLLDNENPIFIDYSPLVLRCYICGCRALGKGKSCLDGIDNYRGF